MGHVANVYNILEPHFNFQNNQFKVRRKVLFTDDNFSTAISSSLCSHLNPASSRLIKVSVAGSGLVLHLETKKKIHKFKRVRKLGQENKISLDYSAMLIDDRI